MRLLAGIGALACATAVSAGPPDFGNAWAEFQNDDARIVAAAGLGLGDTEEKDYAVGDLDRDGRPDLVVVRKEGWHTTGGRANVLFMNESGSLVDRTALYASASDVPNDFGFLMPTNDRDVVITDVNQDGWPDVVTSTTLSPGQPKHISHPRVYINLGDDTQGDWLGLRFEDGRIPQLFVGLSPAWPRFAAVDAGDLTGDDYPELYFGDNDLGAAHGGLDVNDRLLVNDGTGHFSDQTTSLLTAPMYTTTYTTAVVLQDVNNDGARDIARDRGYGQQVSVIYNDPDSLGSFRTDQTVELNLPYYMNTGDLNNDGWLDMLISHNSVDRYVLSRGADAQGVIDWADASLFQYLTGGDDGFASDNYAVDLDRDGFKDAVLTDVDPEIPGCGRRMHVYHNHGGPAGSDVVLLEEAEGPVGGWRGVVGLEAADLQGVHDAAIFDLDDDGDLDMVLGRCSGTNVWMNVTVPPVIGGKVPDGTDGPGLTVQQVFGGNLILRWAPSCAEGDVDYAVYFGTFDELSAFHPVVCSTGGLTSTVVPGPAGSAFFLVVPHNTVHEGSYGLDSDLIERPASATACHTQLLGACE